MHARIKMGIDFRQFFPFFFDFFQIKKVFIVALVHKIID